MNRYYERAAVRFDKTTVCLASPWWAGARRAPEATSRADIARTLAAMLSRAVLVAANPAFDSAFVDAFLRRHGERGAWDYYLADIGSIAFGYVHGRAREDQHPDKPWRNAALEVGPPWRSGYLGEICGVPTAPAADRHTALGDVRWLVELYDAITSPAGYEGATR